MKLMENNKGLCYHLKTQAKEVITEKITEPTVCYDGSDQLPKERIACFRKEKGYKKYVF
ncbi:hypothetical protein [Clostridium sp. E02]|uniref:hypothetical protein n=1 Tax=Clostridium sp. E02 TaxID=2487134 RepID=UPI0013DE5A3C|nr:hypothetical protein [Clostridium sp. E02]